jgi:hypothetical protein
MAYVYKDGERINLDSSSNDYDISYSWECTSNLKYELVSIKEENTTTTDSRKIIVTALNPPSATTGWAYYVKLNVSIKEKETKNSDISLSKTTDVYCYYPIDVLVSDNYSAE